MKISAAKDSQAVRELFHGISYDSHGEKMSSSSYRGKLTSPRKVWNAEEVGILEERFPSMEVNKHAIQSETDLTSKLSASPNQIYDKVRKLKIKKKVCFCSASLFFLHNYIVP